MHLASSKGHDCVLQSVQLQDSIHSHLNGVAVHCLTDLLCIFIFPVLHVGSSTTIMHVSVYDGCHSIEPLILEQLRPLHKIMTIFFTVNQEVQL